MAASLSAYFHFIKYSILALVNAVHFQLSQGYNVKSGPQRRQPHAVITVALFPVDAVMREV
jgi:hypothetical protein